MAFKPMTFKPRVETILPRNRLKRTTLSQVGDVVSINLHCGDDYMARVLFEDLLERSKVQRVYIEIGVGPEEKK